PKKAGKSAPSSRNPPIIDFRMRARRRPAPRTGDACPRHPIRGCLAGPVRLRAQWPRQPGGASGGRARSAATKAAGAASRRPPTYGRRRTTATTRAGPHGWRGVGYSVLGDAVDLGQAGDALADLEQRSEEHTSELQSRENLVCRLLLEKKKKKN